MPRRSLLIIAAALTFFAVLVFSFPARVAYQWFVPPDLQLSGIRGTVWNGSAAQAETAGVFLHDVTWSFRPRSLLSGRIGYGIAATPASGFMESIVEIGVTGDLGFSDVRASIPLQLVQDAAGMPGLRGDVNLRLERLILEDGLPVTADGELAVSGLLAPLIYREPVGGYRVEFFTQSSGIVASVEDTDGIVDLAGSLKISPDRSYQFTALLAPKATTPPNLRQQMQFLGTANDRGQYELRLEGKL